MERIESGNFEQYNATTELQVRIMKVRPTTNEMEQEKLGSVSGTYNYTNETELQQHITTEQQLGTLMKKSYVSLLISVVKLELAAQNILKMMDTG